MDTISSGEFRKRYAKLRKSVIVTVSGHPIGVWNPREVNPDGLNVWPSDRLMAESHRPAADRFNTQPFTPVPKHRK